MPICFVHYIVAIVLEIIGKLSPPGVPDRNFTSFMRDHIRRVGHCFMCCIHDCWSETAAYNKTIGKEYFNGL